MPQGMVPASNKIEVAGVPLEMEWEASGEIYPGDVVEFDTADCPRIKAGTADAVGVIGVAVLSMADPTGRGAKRASAYAENDQVKVVCGPIVVMLRLSASEDITCGEHLQPNTSGEVKAYVCGTDEACQLIAQALETIAVNTLTYQWIMAKWLK